MAHSHIGKIPARKEDSHKGDYGRVLILAGSRGMTGAAYLCAQAALAAGSGIVVNGIQESLNFVMEIKLTEAMTLPLPENKNNILGKKALKTILEYSKRCDAVAVGPGLGLKEATKALVREVVRKVDRPLVIDADGLNALESRIGLVKKRRSSTVITPHPGEMARLIKKDTSFVQLQRVDVAKNFSREIGAIICLKGHKTVIASPDGQVYINKTGNSGMASGGTGDVLTGIVTSFMGQGLDPFGAAVSGVYLHGMAGDIAAEKKGQFSLMATDLIDYLPMAFKKAGIA